MPLHLIVCRLVRVSLTVGSCCCTASMHAGTSAIHAGGVCERSGDKGIGNGAVLPATGAGPTAPVDVEVAVEDEVISARVLGGLRLVEIDVAAEEEEEAGL